MYQTAATPHTAPSAERPALSSRHAGHRVWHQAKGIAIDRSTEPDRPLDAVRVDGATVSLHARDGVFRIRADGRELMHSGHHATERALAALALARLRGATRERSGIEMARVLVGGLGMGFTLRAALDGLPTGSRIDVVERVPAIVRWNRGPLAHLAGSPLADPRVNLVVGNVHDTLARARSAYDAVLLDVDNGPHDLALACNARLYDDTGVRCARRALRPGGVLAVWSAAPAPDYEARLARAGFAVSAVPVRARAGDDRVWHTIVLAVRGPDK